MPRYLKPSAEPMLTGALAIVRRAGDRLFGAAVGWTGQTGTGTPAANATTRFQQSRDLLETALKILDDVERDHMEER